MNHQICRCCGIENPENFFNIFEESRLRLELAQCLSHLNIEFEDGLPDIVCLSCKNQVQEINKFLQKCEQTDRVLRQRCEEANKAIDVALDEVDLECLDSNVLLNLDSLEPEILEEDEMCINTQDLVELGRFFSKTVKALMKINVEFYLQNQKRQLV